MLGRHLEFIRERQYVMDVSPATIRWYPSALKWLDTEAPTQEELTRLVVKMRERGLKATGCKAATRSDQRLPALVERCDGQMWRRVSSSARKADEGT